MSDDIQSQLNLAYEQVEAGQPEAAIATLEPILDANPDNADAWWIYTYAANDPAQARRALENVMRIDPDYPGAKDLFAQLNADFPAAPSESASRPVIRSIAPVAPPLSVPEAPPSMPEPPKTPRALDPVTPPASAIDDVFETPRTTPPPPPETNSERSGSSTMTIVVFAVVVTAVIIALLLLNPGEETPATEQPPTAIAADLTPTDASAQGAVTDEPTATSENAPEAVVTDEATAVVEPTAEAPIATEEAATIDAPLAVETTVPTEPAPEATATSVEADPTAVVTEESTAAPTEAVTTPGETDSPEPESTAVVELPVPDALADYTLADPAVTEESLTIGTTAVVNICSAPGAAARTLLREAMEAFSGAVDEIESEADAIGVRLVNCDTGALLVAVAAMRSDAEAFAAGTLAAADYARTWVAVR